MKYIRLIIQKFVAVFISGSKNEQLPYASKTGSSDLLKVRVLRVIDGDTVDVAHSGCNIRIRLSAIDAPEDDQPGGNNAKWKLIKIIGGQFVFMESYGFDPHGRVLATLYVEHGSKLRNVNERMVMCGHAWVARDFYGHLSNSRQRKLDQLERWARAKRVGLWKFPGAIPPWEWRSAG